MKSSISILIILFLTTLFISCNKEVSTSPPDLISKNSGKLFVDSKPSRAKIYLNNINTGYLTPDTIPYLDMGIYKLTAKLPLFKDSSEFVSIIKDSLTSVFLDYTINPTMLGYLNIDSSPQGAAIFLNDTATGKVTPFVFQKVLPDTYSIVLKKTGYWDLYSTAVVTTGRSSRVYLSLEDTSVFVNYSVSNSPIPTNYLNGVVIDEDGSKWMVDSYNLTKFDDTSWVVFNPVNSSYPGGNVNTIYAFGNEIWICSTNGLVVYKNGLFDIQGTQTGLPSDYIYCAFKENENSIWVGTNLGLSHFDGAAWTIYDVSNSGLPTNSISAIGQDGNNNLWIGTFGSGIVKFDGSSWELYNSENSKLPAGSKVTSLVFLNGSSVWAGFSSIGNNSIGGTAFFDGNIWDYYPSIPSIKISMVSVQTGNIIWVCNLENGFSKYENGSWYSYTTANSLLASNRVFGMAIDRDGSKWIATYGGGLSKYKGD